MQLVQYQLHKSATSCARVGHELVNRGHNFTVLISSSDDISQQTFNSRNTPGMQVLTFQGTAGVGTLEWASNLSRDPVQVDNCMACFIMFVC